METNEYLTGINQGFGARVLVHDTDTYPFPSTEGLYVSSSFETHIGLKQVSETGKIMFMANNLFHVIIKRSLMETRFFIL